jgi:CheY-like chemotaxis protein
LKESHGGVLADEVGARCPGGSIGREALASGERVMGHDIRTIHDGAAAVATARAFRPHVVLLDIGLPGNSGYQVARQIRSDPVLATVVIVAMTGYGREQDKHDARAAGIDHHLTKPVNDEVLEALIEGASAE